MRIRSVLILTGLIVAAFLLFEATHSDNRFDALVMTPIAFYGKAVDQFGEPVADATVEFEANNNPLGKSLARFSKTNAKGLFSVEEMHGLSLAVEVSKAGYYRVKPPLGQVGSYGGFEFASMGGSSIHHPDRNNPVIFTLHKQGELEQLVKLSPKSFKPPPDGLPFAVNMTPQKDDALRQITFRMWAREQDKERSGHFDWRIEVAASNGGILARKSDFDFVAPEGVYQPSEIIAMPAGLISQAWQDTTERSFFVHFDDDRYARIKVSAAAFSGGRIAVTGYLNPKVGSRNLEADPRTH